MSDAIATAMSVPTELRRHAPALARLARASMQEGKFMKVHFCFHENQWIFMIVIHNALLKIVFLWLATGAWTMLRLEKFNENLWIFISLHLKSNESQRIFVIVLATLRRSPASRVPAGFQKLRWAFDIPIIIADLMYFSAFYVVLLVFQCV